MGAEAVAVLAAPAASWVSLICNAAVILLCGLGIRGFWPALQLWNENRNPALVAGGIVLICAGLAANSLIWAPLRLAKLAEWHAVILFYRQFGGFSDILGKGLPAVGVLMLLWAKLDAIYPPSKRTGWNVINVAWFPHSERVLPRALSFRWLRLSLKIWGR